MDSTSADLELKALVIEIKAAVHEYGMAINNDESTIPAVAKLSQLLDVKLLAYGQAQRRAAYLEAAKIARNHKYGGAFSKVVAEAIARDIETAGPA